MAWLDAVISAMETLRDFGGVSVDDEALNPFFIDLPEEDIDEGARRPLELWPLLSEISGWVDRVSDGPDMMSFGRQWIGVYPFKELKIDVLIFVAQPSNTIAVIGLLQALPLGEGAKLLDLYSNGASQFDEVFDALVEGALLT
ncbi:MAG: hypothetical protein AAGI10_12935 [Pseudomonadota bacterium]